MMCSPVFILSSLCSFRLPQQNLVEEVAHAQNEFVDSPTSFNEPHMHPLDPPTIQTLLELRARLKDTFTRDPLQSCASLTQATDRWLVETLLQHVPEDLTSGLLVFALGSYGRAELCLHSDLDVLIEVHDTQLLDDARFEPAIAALMDAARTHRLKLRHAVRTPAQHLVQLEEDWRTPVAMLDARVLFDGGGHTTRSLAVQSALEHLRGETQGRAFVDKLIQAHLDRRRRQSQGVYLLEPDLKSGFGALRDLHTIHWAAQVRFGQHIQELDRPEWSQEQRLDYQSSRSWLLMLRMHLHGLNTRAQDRLRFSEQIHIASRLYPDLTHPSEALMREHYRHTRTCLQLLDRALRQWGSSHWSEATLHSTAVLPGHDHNAPLTPMLAMELLCHASEHELLLGPLLEQQLARASRQWTDSDTMHMNVQRRFLAALTRLDLDPLTSTRLLELGILERLLPEFAPLVCHVQHDTYHVYTTDVHTLKCLERARSLLHQPERDEACARWPAFPQLARHITQPRLFLLAALLHDIGKNRGGDHSNKGADLVPEIARRFDLEEKEKEALEKLVRHHLLLSNTSRRRDITDPRVLSDVLELLDDNEALITLLTCLTFCDMSTVSETSMNDWRASLLLQLHHNLLNALKTQRDTTAHALLLQARIRDSLERQELSSYDAFLEDLPDSSSLGHLSSATHTALFYAYRAHTKTPEHTHVAIQERKSTSQVTYQVIVATRDIPGALTKIAGTLSAQGVNILSAEILSTRSGKILDLFDVEVTRQTPRADAPAPSMSPRRQERLTTHLIAALDEGADVGELLALRQAQHSITHQMPEVPIKVMAYQDVSDDYTVIEVHAPDRRGLLHDIAQVMHAQDVEIRRSKLDLLGNQAIDTFYVESMFSGKLSDEATRTLIKTLDEVMRAPFPDWAHDDAD